MNFDDETVFIIGAGASYPYGLPLGEELINSFSIIINDHPDKTENPTNLNNAKFFAFLKEKGFELNFIEGVIEKIKGTGSLSVDEYLMEKEENSSESKLAKALIYYCIHQKCNRFNFLKKDWIEPLGSYLMEHHKDSFLSGKVSFISFNYDQLLRAKIEYLVRNKFNYQDYTFNNVLHVYGSLVDRSFKPAHGINEDELIEIYEESKHLSLFRKQRPKTSKIISKKLASAKNIVLLGYGFNRENNYILVGDDKSAANFRSKNVRFTAHGFSEEDRKEIKKMLAENGSIGDELCLDLITDLTKKVFL